MRNLQIKMLEGDIMWTTIIYILTGAAIVFPAIVFMLIKTAKATRLHDTIQKTEKDVQTIKDLDYNNRITKLELAAEKAHKADIEIRELIGGIRNEIQKGMISIRDDIKQNNEETAGAVNMLKDVMTELARAYMHGDKTRIEAAVDEVNKKSKLL